MARTSFNVEAGRQYLAHLPEFHPTKPLSDYKPATIKRYVSQFQAQQQAGVPVNRQAARGHVVTPEHGPRGARPRLPASPRDYRGGKLPHSKYLGKTQKLPRPIVHVRPINVPEHLDLADGAVVDVYYDSPETLHRLRDVGGDRVVLSGYDCELGVWRSLGVNPGHNRGWTARAILEAWAASGLDFESWFILIANSTSSDPDQRAAVMGHVCIWRVYVYPLNPHLSPRRFANTRT